MNWAFEENNCHLFSAVYAHPFWRNKITYHYNLVQIVPRLSTANTVYQEQFKVLTNALLRPTERTLQLRIAFCVCIVQRAKYNTCVFQCSKQKHSALLHNPALRTTKQASPFCVHFKSHHYTTEGI